MSKSKLERSDKKPRKKKNNDKKEEGHIEFDMSAKENMKDIFSAVPTKKTKTTSVEELDLKQSYLLPIDMHIRPKRLVTLFLRGFDGKSVGKKVLKSTKEPENIEMAEVNDNFIDANIDFNNFADERPEGEDYEKIQLNLESIFGKDSDDKKDRHINIRALKDKMWNLISDKVPNKDGAEAETKTQKIKKKNQKMAVENSNLNFSEVCEDLPNQDSGNNLKNISIHSCFVTILHLANEKGLNFVKDGDDFRIFQEVS